MYFPGNERIGIIVDGASMHAAARALEFDIDFSRICRFSSEAGRLIRSEYYTVIPAASATETQSIRPLTDWLDYNGWHLITPVGRDVTDHATGRRFLNKSAIIADIAVGIIRMGRIVDHILLFASRSDYCPAIDDVQTAGVRVTVVSTVTTTPVIIADELRRQADQFIDLDSIRDEICRPQGSRPPREARDRQTEVERAT